MGSIPTAYVLSSAHVRRTAKNTPPRGYSHLAPTAEVITAAEAIVRVGK